MLTVKIYGIVNPLNNEIFYVGASFKPEQRYEIHKNGAEWHKVTYKRKQVEQIKKAGLVPLIKILDEVDPCDARLREQFFIDKYIKPKRKNTISQNKSGYSLKSKNNGHR